MKMEAAFNGLRTLLRRRQPLERTQSELAGPEGFSNVSIYRHQYEAEI